MTKRKKHVATTNEQSSIVKKCSEHTLQDELDYWTAERMQAAKPISLARDLPVKDDADGFASGEENSKNKK